jgi:hypothetical protein
MNCSSVRLPEPGFVDRIEMKTCVCFPTGEDKQMTLVCVWRESSFGIDRLTALADMRISRKENGGRATISDLTRKLLPLSICCHETDRLQSVTGSLHSPYQRVEAAIAYSGNVVEAQAIIAHVQQDLSNLIAIQDRPSFDYAKLGVWIEQLVARYFEKHANKAGTEVTLIVFGWAEQTPWFHQVSWEKGKVSRLDGVFDDETLLVVGEDSKFVKIDLDNLRTAISRHKRKLREQLTSDDSCFEHELERARHEVAELKSIQQAILDKIFCEANTSIGGPLQKLELAPGQRAACTRLSGDYDLIKDLSLSSGGVLAPLDLTQEM